MTKGAARDIIAVISRNPRALKRIRRSRPPLPKHARPAARLYVERELAPAAAVAVDGSQAHYLARVMRLGVGDRVALFNGADGEWGATVSGLGAGRAELRVDERLREQERVRDLWLVHAPIKGPRLATVVEKATELGVDALLPVTTRNTVVGRVNARRLRARAIEAAEQCGRLSVPAIRPLRSLDAVIDSWPRARTLVFCDETAAAPPLVEALRAAPAPPGGAWAVLIGPEGGFAAAEAHLLRRLPFVVPAKLGPRILRADTAAIAALSLWQAATGEWRDAPPA